PRRTARPLAGCAARNARRRHRPPVGLPRPQARAVLLSEGRYPRLHGREQGLLGAAARVRGRRHGRARREQGPACEAREVRREARPRGAAGDRLGSGPVRRARRVGREEPLRAPVHGHASHDLPGRSRRADRPRLAQGQGQGPRRRGARGRPGPLVTSVSQAIRDALLTGEPRAKIMATRALVRAWRRGALGRDFGAAMPDRPAWPAELQLLPPNRMPKRGRGGSERARIALWHALAHIEFAAIDLALDMAGRFGGEMGREFVDDFLSVAADEAMHFALIERRLRDLGSGYGALPAHDGLWEAALETRHDVAARLAVVPMVLEARGLDVTPATRDRLASLGDERGARILQRILDDE